MTTLNKALDTLAKIILGILATLMVASGLAAVSFLFYLAYLWVGWTAVAAVAFFISCIWASKRLRLS